MFVKTKTNKKTTEKEKNEKQKKKTQIGLLKTLVVDNTRAEVTDPWGVPVRAIKCAIPNPGHNESRWCLDETLRMAFGSA